MVYWKLKSNRQFQLPFFRLNLRPFNGVVLVGAAFILLLTLISLAHPASGRTIVVDDTGHGDYMSLMKAVSETESGDVIEIQDGNYSIDNVGDYMKDNLTFIGQGPGKTHLVFYLNDSTMKVYNSYILFEGVNITSNSTGSNTLLLSGDNITMKNCTVNNIQSFVFSPYKNSEFLNNRITGTGFLFGPSDPGTLETLKMENNTVNGLPLLYMTDKANMTITENASYILLNCSNITFKELNISGLCNPLSVYFSHNITLQDCSYHSEGFSGLAVKWYATYFSNILFQHSEGILLRNISLSGEGIAFIDGENLTIKDGALNSALTIENADNITIRDTMISGSSSTRTTIVNAHTVPMRNKISMDGVNNTLLSGVNSTVSLKDSMDVIIRDSNLKANERGMALGSSDTSPILVENCTAESGELSFGTKNPNDMSSGPYSGVRIAGCSLNASVTMMGMSLIDFAMYGNAFTGDHGLSTFSYGNGDITIINNTFEHKGIYFVFYSTPDNLNLTIHNNTVAGRPIYFYKDTSGVKVPEDAAQVILYNTSHLTISELNISDVSTGAIILHTTNLTISDSSFNTDHECIIMRDTSHIIIQNSLFRDSYPAIYMIEGKDLSISDCDFNNSNLYLLGDNISISNSKIQHHTGRATGSRGTYDMGISTSRNLTLINTQISGFYRGVYLAQGGGRAIVSMRNTHITGNKIGMEIWVEVEVRLTGCTISDNENYGILLSHNNARILLNDTVISGNGKYGLRVDLNQAVEVVGGIFEGNGNGIDSSFGYLTLRNAAVLNSTEKGVSANSGTLNITGCNISGNAIGVQTGFVYLQRNLTISNSVFLNNTEYGIYLHSSPFASISNCTISGSQTGIFLNNGARIEWCKITNNNLGIDVGTQNWKIVVRYCIISGNTEYGIKTLSHLDYSHPVSPEFFSVDARYNYWGAPSGPQHYWINPGGKGDKVSDGVNVSPYYKDTAFEKTGLLKIEKKEEPDTFAVTIFITIIAVLFVALGAVVVIPENEFNRMGKRKN